MHRQVTGSTETPCLLILIRPHERSAQRLGLTTAAFPGQPLIYAALIIGMLVEFPHLTALKYLLLHRSPEKQITPQIPRPVG